MDAQTTVRLIEFVINEDETICNLFYESNEPGNPFWGGGWMHKIFNPDKSIVDFMNEELPNYLETFEKGKLSGQFKSSLLPSQSFLIPNKYEIQSGMSSCVKGKKYALTNVTTYMEYWKEGVMWAIHFILNKNN